MGTYITQVNDHDALSISYDYDGNGNITRISIDGGTEIRYVYDALDQLIREDNGQLGKTFVYSYDDAGNITSIVTYPLTAAGATPSSPLSTKSYGYSTDGWGDRLTSFNGNAITYDTVGNPLTYNNGKSYSFSWTGRQMTGAVTGGASYSFTYNVAILKRLIIVLGKRNRPKQRAIGANWRATHGDYATVEKRVYARQRRGTVTQRHTSSTALVSLANRRQIT